MKTIYPYLTELEEESIYILRETFALFRNPVILYSIGKDSSVLLHFARKAFFPGKMPFPLLHIDTGFKFPEMIAFRDSTAKKIHARLLVEKNEEPRAQAFAPEEAHSDAYIYYKKTKPLLETIKKYDFDAAIGGARREEEKSRAKERIFSVRSEMGGWDPKRQRPELWRLYNHRLGEGESMRVFPLSNWTELDVWRYIHQEGIEVVPLYFAQLRAVVRRNGIHVRVDAFTRTRSDEEVVEMMCRYRTLGCSPSTGAVPSEALTVGDIIKELENAQYSERQTRAIDATSATAMEEKKREGYF